MCDVSFINGKNVERHVLLFYYHTLIEDKNSKLNIANIVHQVCFVKLIPYSNEDFITACTIVCMFETHFTSISSAQHPKEDLSYTRVDEDVKNGY